MKLRNLVGALALIALVLPATLRAADDDLRKELDRLKKDLDATKGELEAVKKKSSSSGAPIASAAAKVENKYGPNANVTTKQGQAEHQRPAAGLVLQHSERQYRLLWRRQRSQQRHHFRFWRWRRE